MCCFPTLRLFFLFVASSAYSNSYTKLVLNTNIELSINPERFSQRQGYGPHSPNKHGYSSVVSGEPSPHFRRRSRLPDPDQEVLLKIPATFNCRCYNDDPVQGRIHYQSRRGWLQRLVEMAYQRQWIKLITIASQRRYLLLVIKFTSKNTNTAPIQTRHQ